MVMYSYYVACNRQCLVSAVSKPHSSQSPSSRVPGQEFGLVSFGCQLSWQKVPGIVLWRIPNLLDQELGTKELALGQKNLDLQSCWDLSARNYSFNQNCLASLASLGPSHSLVFECLANQLVKNAGFSISTGLPWLTRLGEGLSCLSLFLLSSPLILC